jgi:mitochondrial inner membrane protein COX18
MLIPIATQLPLFALTSLVFAHACALPTPLDSEAFLSLTSLSHPDPIAGLPIALGLISLANVESTRLPQTAEQRERAAKVEAWAAERKARGEVVIRPRKNLEFALRALCVGRIVWASMIPGVSSLFAHSFLLSPRAH